MNKRTIKFNEKEERKKSLSPQYQNGGSKRVSPSNSEAKGSTKGSDSDDNEALELKRQRLKRLNYTKVNSDIKIADLYVPSLTSFSKMSKN